MTAALPLGYGLTALLIHIGFLLLTVRLPRFVKRQDVFIRLAVYNVDVVINQVDWLYPITGGINHHLDTSAIHIARDQHRHQGYSYCVVMQFFWWDIIPARYAASMAPRRLIYQVNLS